MGALVAGLSVYFTYKGRHNQFRQVVYGRQMDAYFDITESMADLYTAAQNALAARQPLAQGGGRPRAVPRGRRGRSTSGSPGPSTASLIVLPSKVKAAVDHFNETLLAISDPADGRPPADAAAEPRGPGPDLAKAYERAVNCIRHHLAVDSLTTGMLNEMGIGSESVALKGLRSGVNPLVPVGGRPTEPGAERQERKGQATTQTNAAPAGGS